MVLLVVFTSVAGHQVDCYNDSAVRQNGKTGGSLKRSPTTAHMMNLDCGPSSASIFLLSSYCAI